MPSDSPKWHRYLRFWRPNVSADVDAELAFHVDARTQELCGRGMEYAAARSQALREFGDLGRTRATLRAMDEEHLSHMRRVDVLADLARDVRVALRSLRRSPGLVVVVTLTLALGIGITCAIYSVVDTFLFRPLPGVYGSALVVLGRTDAELAMPHGVSFPDFRDYRADTTVFASLTAYTTRVVTLATDRGADRLWVDEATANYFSTIGLHAYIGRTFLPDEDDGVLAHPTIVLSYKAWRSHFAADSSVIGRVIRVNDHPMTVIGVTPSEFHGVRPLVDIDGVTCFNQIWPAEGAALEDRRSFAYDAIGRLRPGISLSQARAAVRLDAERLQRAYPTTNKDVNAVLVAERFSRPSISVSALTPALSAVFMTLVLLVLGVACANVASLLLARVIGRERELAIRAAIGASQWRLVRPVIVECVLLALLGGLGALGVAFVSIQSLASIRVATDLPVRWGVELDGRVVGFAALVTLLTAACTALAPVLASRRRNLNAALKSSTGNSASRTHQRIRSLLVAGQIAISAVVLVGAGLFVRSARSIGSMSLGFRTDHVALLSTDLPPQRYDTLKGTALYEDLIPRVRALPGVRDAGLTSFIPFGFERDNLTVVPIASSVAIPVNGFSYFTTSVAGDYFAALGIPLLDGRLFTDRDDAGAPRVAVVNDAFAKALWPGQTATGKQFHAGGSKGPVVTVIGVVKGMQDLLPGETPKPFVFQPLAQSYRSGMTLLIHTSTAPLSLIPPARALIASIDPSLPVFDVRTFDEHLRNGQAFLFTRIGMAFTLVFGVLALVLAMIGIYGVVSYSVALRTREIGVRVALGATLPGVLALVMRQGLRLAGIGAAAGILISFGVTSVLSSILYGVRPYDPIVLGGVLALLIAIATLASFAPARRATRIDPITALRSD
jgi:putative ABC transport system permease protein